MSSADAERWDLRYANKIDPYPEQIDADALLLRHRQLLVAGQTALDVACGLGHNSLWLAEHGLVPTALDISSVGLGLLNQQAEKRGLQIKTQHADLDDWHWPQQHFDLVLVFRFLNRALFADIKSCLRPGGLLIYQTFGPAKLINSPDFNPDFVLEDGELGQQFHDFECIEANDRDGNFATFVGRKISESN